MKKTVEMDVVSFEELWQSLPEEERKDEIKYRLREVYNWELNQLILYANHAQQPSVVLERFHQSGSQNIARFWVNDLSLPKTSAINFHGQATSQWVYAGAVLVQEGRISTHH